MKTHILKLNNEENKRLQKIKMIMMVTTVNKAIKILINTYYGGLGEDGKDGTKRTD